jgi:hypothetical protein
MRRADCDHQPWHLVPFSEGKRRNFRRSNTIIISILAFFVLGLFVLALGLVEARLQHHHAAAAHVSVSQLFAPETDSLRAL